MTTTSSTKSKSVLLQGAHAPYYAKGAAGQGDLAKHFEQLTADRDSCREARTEVGTARGALEVADQHKRWGSRPNSSCVSEDRLFRRTMFQAAKSKFVLHLWHLHRSWRDTLRLLEIEQPKASDLVIDNKLNVIRVTQLLLDVRVALSDHERYLKSELPDHRDALYCQMQETSELHDLIHSDVANTLLVMGMLVDHKVRTLPPIFYSLHPAETSGLAPLSAHVRDLLAATRAFTESEDLLWNRLAAGTVRGANVVLPDDEQDLWAYETYRKRLLSNAVELEASRYLAAARRDAYLKATRENYVYLQTEATSDVIAEDGPVNDAFMHSISWLNHALIRATYRLKRFQSYKALLPDQAASADGKYKLALRLIKSMVPKH